MRITQPLHQDIPRARGAVRPPAQFGGLAGKAIAGNRRNHDIERVIRRAAIGRRVGQRANGLGELENRARPAVRQDDRQRVGVARADVDEMNIHPVDGRDELGQRIQLFLGLAPVILGSPIFDEFLHPRGLDALGFVAHGFLVRPARGGNPLAQIVELALGHMHLERTNTLVGARALRGSRLRRRVGGKYGLHGAGKTNGREHCRA
ncbi:hypothetical protein D3C81_1161260 [compost metagenome]